MLLPLFKVKDELFAVNDELTTAIELTFNEPVIVWFPLNEFEPVVATELVQVFNEDVYVANVVNLDNTDELNVSKFEVSINKLAVVWFTLALNVFNDVKDAAPPQEPDWVPMVANLLSKLAVCVFKFVIDVTKLAVDWEAVNVFKFVIDVTKLAVETDAVNVFNWDIEDVTEPVTKYLKSNELVNCEEPLIVPDGTALTLPLKVYLVSYDDVNWDEPLMIPLPIVSYEEVALFKLLIEVTKLAVDWEAV